MAKPERDGAGSEILDDLHVKLFSEKDWKDGKVNTVVLPYTALVVPLERDAEGDPGQADEVSIETYDRVPIGSIQAGDKLVTRDDRNGWLYFPLSGLRFAPYRLSVRVAGERAVVATSVLHRLGGTFLGGVRLGPTKPGHAAAHAPVPQRKRTSPNRSAGASAHAVVPDDGGG